MSNLAYIDSYFNKELTSDQVMEFEQKLKDDPQFAEEAAFYCSAMHVIKEQNDNEQKARFRKIYEASKLQSKKQDGSRVKKLWPYLAAALLISAFALGWLLYNRPSSPDRLANQIIKELVEIPAPVKMSADRNTLDSAIQLYNDKKLTEALQLFERIIQSDSKNETAIKMAGIVSLRIKDYDQAINYFTQLQNLILYANPGKFYHALALIKRNRTGDHEMAKQLLKQVIDQNLAEKETAIRLIKSF